ncbi:657_t:CDS:1, partial [Ambispora leptoticha]
MTNINPSFTQLRRTIPAANIDKVDDIYNEKNIDALYEKIDGASKPLYRGIIKALILRNNAPTHDSVIADYIQAFNLAHLG